MTQKRTALITGGAGFIGSHLSDALIARGWRVQIIDDLSTGSVKNISHLKQHPDFSYVLDTALNKGVMMELVDEADVIFHLAAAVGVNLIIEKPVYTTQVNIQLTDLVLELAANKKKPVLITSTSEVYGKLDKQKFAETDNLVLGSTDNSRWCYAASKIVDEFLAKAYFKEKGLPTIIVRLFNTVGPRQTGRYGMVLPTFVRQAMSGEPITVFGDGQQCRSFTWVLDVVDGLINLISNEEAYGQTFNLGGNTEISIYALAELVKQMTGSNSEIKIVSYEEAYDVGFEDMQRRLADISKAGKLIGFSPTLEVGEMISEVIAWEKSSGGNLI